MNQATALIKPNKVIYIGEDNGFFKSIQQRFLQTYNLQNWDFKTLGLGKKTSAQSLFLDILEYDPHIIYIDLSENRNIYLPLAGLLGRDNFFYSKPIIGLVEDKEQLNQCLSTGVDLLYIKCGEMYDLVYHPMAIAFPKQVKKPSFAKAKVGKEVDLYEDFRVGYITPTQLHIEGKYRLEEGNHVKLETELPVKNVPSKNFVVRSRSENNLYYDFQYSYDLDIEFLEEPDLSAFDFDSEISTNLSEKEKASLFKNQAEAKRSKLADYQNEVKLCEKKHKAWVVDNMDPGGQKKTKILIIDKNMRIFKNPDIKPIDQYPYGIRTQTMLSNEMTEINKILPSIIAIQCHGRLQYQEDRLLQEILKERKNSDHKIEAKEGGLTAAEVKKIDAIKEQLPVWEREEIEKIALIIRKIKSIENYAPVVVLFHCYFQTSNSLQTTFQYPLIVTHNEGISIDTLLNLAGIYESKQEKKYASLVEEKVKDLKKKDPQKYRSLTVDDFLEKRYYIRKTNALSFASYKFPVNLLVLTESEVIFSTEKDLVPGIYRSNYPVEMSWTLVNVEDGKFSIKDKGENVYRGLIHSITEADKKSIRRSINEVFFAPMMEKRNKEDKEYWERHEKLSSEKSQKE